jgi:hypothetical protein
MLTPKDPRIPHGDTLRFLYKIPRFSKTSAMKLRPSIILTLAAACILAGQAAFAADDFLNQGMEAFNEKRYYAAEDLFNKSIQQNPNNQSVYYFLGKTLECLYDSKSAKEAYQTCFRLNPFSIQGKYAKQAVTTLSGQIEASNHVPSDTPEQTAKTIKLINSQTADAKQRWGAIGNANAAWSITKTNNELSRLGYQNRIDMAAAQNANRYGRTYNMGDISNPYAIRTSYIRSDGQVQANLAKAEAAKAQADLQTSANNLEYLLADKKKDGEAKLRAFGTNLYTRYYGDEDHEAPTPPPDPGMKATQMRLSDFAPVKRIIRPTGEQSPEAVQQKFDSQTGIQSYR